MRPRLRWTVHGLLARARRSDLHIVARASTRDAAAKLTLTLQSEHRQLRERGASMSAESCVVASGMVCDLRG